MSNKYTSVGSIVTIFDTKQVSEKFRKREFVVEIPDGKYPQPILFQLTGDRCSALDEYRAGDEVSLEWNLRGRKWSKGAEDRYFVSCDVWRIERVAEKQASKPAGASDVQSAFGEDPDGIPF